MLPVLMPWRRLSVADRTAVVAVLAAGVVMTGYVIRVGGDFMHARMLPPPTFVLLLPVMGVPFPVVPRRAVRVAVAGGLAAVGLWAVVCGIDFRMAQAPMTIPSNGITNERSFWVQRTGDLYPTTPGPYIHMVTGTTSATAALRLLVGTTWSAGHPLLAYTDAAGNHVTTALNRPGVPVAVTGDILGTLGAIVPLNGIAIDIHGLSYPYGSHMEPLPGGRIGHDKTIGVPWIIADYGASVDVTGVNAAEVDAARRALGCGDMARLRQATRSALTWNRFWSNVADSYTLTKFRVPNDPPQAEALLCGAP
jgi:arabinofuranosyltransferase